MRDRETTHFETKYRNNPFKRYPPAGKYRKILCKWHPPLEYTPKNSYKKVPTLHKKYRKFLEKKYPSHGKSTEICKSADQTSGHT